MNGDEKIGDRRISIREFLVSLPRSTKKLVVTTTDIIGFSACAGVVVWLLAEESLQRPSVAWACLLVAVIATLLAWVQGLYRSVVRYVGLGLIIAAGKSAGASALISATVMYAAGLAASPLKWFVAFWALSFIYMCCSRLLARYLLIKRRSPIDRERVIIYGAGSAGAQLAVSLLGSDEYLPVAMVDDNPSLQGSLVRSLLVYTPAQIGQLIRETGAKRILLAIPSATRRRRRDVLHFLSELPVYIQTVPRLEDLVSGKAKYDDLRDVAVEDLLGRDPVPPNPELLGGTISGKNVLVTGAGGSIGSELCRQIVKLRPKTLVIFDISEYALYEIEKELSNGGTSEDIDCTIVPLLGSVHHESRVDEILRTFDIETVYHAAAYKHVPLVEYNILEGVHNNVVGTWKLARVAAAAGVDSFVLISTDKAVSPTNVMGATKRFAELILQALQDRSEHTRFCMVRFGNVLESSGSVVPLFREQIRAGGPVTVTHPEIIRYFMTIPEAAQLVIQAASMAKGGDVFVLDMGEPVKILELARRMILLTGLTIRDDNNPDGDVSIRFTGLRPAEKLYEELLIGSAVSGTSHPRIMRATENKLSHTEVQEYVDALLRASAALDREEVRSILMRAVSEYEPTNGIEDLVTMRQQKAAASDHSATIVGFPKGAKPH